MTQQQQQSQQLQSQRSWRRLDLNPPLLRKLLLTRASQPVLLQLLQTPLRWQTRRRCGCRRQLICSWPGWRVEEVNPRVQGQQRLQQLPLCLPQRRMLRL